MEKTSTATNHPSSAAHRSAQRSATLNRKYVKRPAGAAQDIRVVRKQPTPEQLKDRAVKQALRSVAQMDSTSKQPQSTLASNATSSVKSTSTRPKSTHIKSKSRKSRKQNGARVALAFTCAAACVAVVAFFIYLNMPDLSVRVTAMQNGINSSYPHYVPRDYSLANVTSETGKITMEFTGPEQNAFTLTEERSSWDSNALLNNFVKAEWGENYVTIREQGLTLYVSGSDAAWVDGGIFYNLDASGNNLTKKQIKNIAVSL